MTAVDARRRRARHLRAAGPAAAVGSLALAVCACSAPEPPPPGAEPVCPESNDGGYACRYDDPYSGSPECREYFGDWSEEDAVEDCNSIFTGVTGEVSHEPCDRVEAFGCCTIDAEGELYHVTWYYGGSVETTVEVCKGMLSGAWEDRE